MKNIRIYIFLVCLASVFYSCQEKLDLVPPSFIGDNGFYENADQVEGGVIAIYDGLQQVPLREFALLEMRTDNTETRSSEGDWAQFESFSVQPTNLAIGTYWQANYNVIFRSNQVIKHLGVVTDETLKNQFEGEAKFARALAHFNLVRAFGAVPLVDQVIIQTNTGFFGRNDVAEVLAFVETDLTEAVNLLPEKSGIGAGRASKGAAQALLAKVKLTRGDYAAAETILSSLVNNANYTLEENYNDVFYSEMNSEIIFAIPYLDDNTTESQDFSFEMTVGGQASGLNFITDDFIAAVDVSDVERTMTLYDANVNRAVGKFLTQSANVRQCGNDWIVLRLADVLLMHSEAILAGGASTQSLQAIQSYNKVRVRAGMTPLAEDGSATLTKQMLLDERRVELAFENHRFYDLIRFGEAENVLGAFATTKGYSFAPTDLLLPIPQREINVSGGALTQNPGY
ncbi:hypothetical protein BKI52_33675 [marine bacterium AO1-C]|nr:hypothetical protein BKI52_33675 [marine bacterium AO1-C]